jgi:hypothetical protein
VNIVVTSNAPTPSINSVVRATGNSEGMIKTSDFINSDKMRSKEKLILHETSLNVPAYKYVMKEAALLMKPFQIKLNPNPVDHTLNISLDDVHANGQLSISVLSVSGDVIKTLQLKKVNNNISLNVSSLSPGVYFIKAISGNKFACKEFVKL